MHIDKAILLKEFMDSRGNHGAHAKRRLKGVRARTQVLDGAQVFQRVPLLLQRVIRRAGALYHNFARANLKRLRCVGRKHQLTRNGNCAARGKSIAQISIVALKDDLNRGKACAVGQFYKAKGLALAHCTHPAADSDRADIGFRRFLNLG